MKPIILDAAPSERECIGVVRLSKEAEMVVRRLQYKTGLPAKRIVSTIIEQAESLIEIRKPDDDE